MFIFYKYIKKRVFIGSENWIIQGESTLIPFESATLYKALLEICIL